MKRIAVALLCAMLLFGSVVPPEGEAASSKTVYILTVNVDGARVRKEPNSSTDNVEVSLKKGTKVFYLGMSGAWVKILSEYGAVGYTYKGFLKYYGAISKESIYVASAKTTLYKSNSTTSKKLGTIAEGQYVIVYAVKSGWAYIHTISGSKGFVKTANLEAP